MRVVNAVLSGMSQSEAARSFGVSRWSVVRWVGIYRSDGEAALREGKRGRRAGAAGKISPQQSAQVRLWITSHAPEHFGLPHLLWTRRVVRELIRQQYGIAFSLTAVGNLLIRLGLVLSHPRRQLATHADPTVRHWLAEDFPKIARNARREGRVIFWLDLLDVAPSDGAGHAQETLRMAIAISNKGESAFMVHQQGVDAPALLGFCERLARYARQQVVLIMTHGRFIQQGVLPGGVLPATRNVHMLLLPLATLPPRA